MRKSSRRTGAQPPSVNLIALEVHRIAVLVLDPYLDARRLGKVPKDLRGLALGKLRAVEIDADRNATIGGMPRCRFHAGHDRLRPRRRVQGFPPARSE
jgi:hypothetical protein